MPLRMTQAEVDAYTQKLSQWRSGVIPKAPGRRKKHGPCEFKLPEIRDGVMRTTLPIRVVNTANVREHWGERNKRNQAHKDIVMQTIRGFTPPPPAVVRLVRIGPREMDSDGYTIALKAVRDAVAECFCLDDGSPLLQFEYAQERGEFGVRVEVRPR